LAHNLLGDVYLDHGREAAQSETALAQEKFEAAAAQFATSVQLSPPPNLLLAALLGLGASYEELEKLSLRQHDPEEARDARDKARAALAEAFRMCPDCER